MQTIRRREFLQLPLSFSSVSVTACGAGADSGTQFATAPVPPAPAPAPSPSPVFPLSVSADARYLVDANGRPFPILGRTSWFITSISAADRSTYLDDTVAKGFTAIEFHVLNHDARANDPPWGNAGTLLPFTNRLDGAPWSGSLSYSSINNEAPDFTMPSEAYWAFVDGLIADCESRGIAVLMFPAYWGAVGQGFGPEMVANVVKGGARLRTYGAFIANRYRARGNIIWMLGGDFDGFSGNELTAEQDLVNGMLSISGQESTQFCAEWSSGTIATDQSTFAKYMTLNGSYDWTGAIATQTRRGYADTSNGTKPSFVLETCYDQEGADGNGFNPNAVQPIRKYIWRGWINGNAGYVEGNGYIWTFNSGWQMHLSTQGQNDLARLNAFIKSISWHRLVPSGLGAIGRLIASGGGTIDQDDYVAAAAIPDGAMLVAYLGPGHSGSVSIDMAKLRGPATARWFDPTSGAYTAIGSFANSGSRAFTPPGKNTAGSDDWVLRLDA